VHPDGDEIVVLLSGAIDLVLDEPGGERTVELRGRAAAIVPRGVWHTANVHGPARRCHITRGAGNPTQAPLAARARGRAVPGGLGHGLQHHVRRDRPADSPVRKSWNYSRCFSAFRSRACFDDRCPSI